MNKQKRMLTQHAIDKKGVSGYRRYSFPLTIPCKTITLGKELMVLVTDKIHKKESPERALSLTLDI